MKSKKELINLTQTAHLLNVSEMTIRRWVKRGLLTPASRTVGGNNRFNKEDVIKASSTMEEKGKRYLLNHFSQEQSAPTVVKTSEGLTIKSDRFKYTISKIDNNITVTIE